MSILGEFERLLADLYPYRVPLSIAACAIAAVLLALVIRRGWHRPVVGWVNSHRLSSVIAGVLFLAVAVPAGNYLLSPLWERTTLVEANPLDAVVTSGSSGTSGDSSEMASPTPDAGQAEPGRAADSGPALVSQGVFRGADDFHTAEGQALIVETAPGQFVLRFDNFSIRNGPDLFVYLSSDPAEPSADGVRLGALKATDGAFNYEIPPGIDISELRYAMVWCDQFAVLFATALLEA